MESERKKQLILQEFYDSIERLDYEHRISDRWLLNGIEESNINERDKNDLVRSLCINRFRAIFQLISNLLMVGIRGYEETTRLLDALESEDFRTVYDSLEVFEDALELEAARIRRMRSNEHGELGDPNP